MSRTDTLFLGFPPPVSPLLVSFPDDAFSISGRRDEFLAAAGGHLSAFALLGRPSPLRKSGFCFPPVLSLPCFPA